MGSLPSSSSRSIIKNGFKIENKNSDSRNKNRNSIEIEQKSYEEISMLTEEKLYHFN
jgi:hypothetical protein